jgi:hypothetical protein
MSDKSDNHIDSEETVESMPRASHESVTEVWHWREADPYRRMHEGVAIDIKTGDQVATKYYETSGFSQRAPVLHLLSLTSFAEGDASTALTVEEVDAAHVEVIRMRGFEVQKQHEAAFQRRFAAALTGELDGFGPVVAGLLGFHSVPGFFEELWRAAGRPKVKVRRPHPTPSASGGEAPAAIPYLESATVSLARRRIQSEAHDDE